MGKAKRRQILKELAAAQQTAPAGPSAVTGSGLPVGTSDLARQLRFGNWRPFSYDADSEAAWQAGDERAFSRDLVRTAPVAAGAIQTRASKIIGTGLTLQSRINADELGLSEDEASEWQSKTEKRFHMWARSRFADVTREQNFYQLQDLVLRSHDESGDVFSLLVNKQRQGWPFRLAVQVVEADRVCNPNGKMDAGMLVSGVERATDGEPVKIHLAKYHPGNVKQYGANEWTEVPFYAPSGRRNVLHLKKMQRPGQTRGRPCLGPIIATVKQLTRYSDAEVDAAVNSAALAVFAMMDGTAFQDIYSDQMRETYITAAAEYDGGLNSGKTVRLLPGESITSPTPGRPNPNFEGFFGAMLNLVSMGLNLPKEVLSKAFNASYSASRAALLDAWHTWKIEREWFASNWSQPIYEEWLADSIALGIIDAPGFFADPFIREAWCGSNWGGDGPGALDPLKEAQAAEKRIEVGITTQAEETVAYDGGDWEEKTRQRVREVKVRREGGLEVEAQPAAAPMPEPVEDEDSPEDDMEDADEQDDPVEDSTAILSA
jgi:lambda family phage portal protein